MSHSDRAADIIAKDGGSEAVDYAWMESQEASRKDI
jgi:hypothetical protein